MPLDVQWFIYALVSNGALTGEDARQLYADLGPETDLAAFAQAVLDKLVADLSEEDAESVLNQIQTVIDYAVEQAETGIGPRYEEEAEEAEVWDEPGAARGDLHPEGAGGERILDFHAPVLENFRAPGKGEKEPEERKFGAHHQAGIVQDSATRFEGLELDLSGLQSYDDLPGFEEVSALSKAQLQERMIILLTCLRALGCSDLHLSAGSQPFVRRMLGIERISDYVLTAEDARRLNLALVSAERRGQFEEEMDINFALEVGQDRFRVCLMMHKDGIEGSYRLVPDHICTLEELGFLESDVTHIKRLLDYHNGLVLVTGPIGSGKTTTLAAMVDIINDKRTDHIITVEDPIEILQWSKNCQVTQREIGRHTVSYHAALKGALREDPDVIVIGEMHDLETIENAITASETGHLVIGTLHTSDAANTLNRLLDVFPPSQQPQIRAMTAGSLRGIICQRLVPAAAGGLTVAYEIMVNTMAVGSIINEGKTFRLKSTMATGSRQGMCTLDQCLLEKYKRGLITREVAHSLMRDQSVISQLQAEWATREARKLQHNG
ncbi:PilT/PilU family type 4a pilus ATPase [uncultured Victivallis sp.]|uniref:type IV pilus twitching motility protein PilT n=1 Tax=uncultured Victivallis sp. TaxID=354118 RepID=UPI002583594A|nr:PilT/PilU family type 4a pilus ATPase [uncultured Victivallis sp.]